MTAAGRSSVLIAVLLLTTSTYAGDFCFNSSSPPNPAPATNPDILVFAQNFQLPGKGKCKPIVGFDVGYTNGAFARPVSGMACLTSAATTLRVGFMLHASAQAIYGQELFVDMTLPYPALSNGVVYLHRTSQDVAGNLNVVRVDGVAGPCGFKSPIP